MANTIVLNSVPKKKKVSAKVTKTIQQSIPFIKMHSKGILETENGFSKCYYFADASYDLEDEEKQDKILLSWEKFLNHFKTSVSMQLILETRKIPDKGITKNYLLPLKDENNDDGYNEYRKEYNSIIMEKIKEGRNDFIRNRYVVLTLDCDKIENAEREFINLDKGVQECLLQINKTGCKPLNCYEYAELLYSFYNGTDRVAFDKLCEAYMTGSEKDRDLSMELLRKKGTTVKNFIAPSSMEVTSEYICLNENRYVASTMVTQFPPYLETRFLNDVSDIGYENIVCLTLQTLTRKKAVSTVKTQNNAVRGDVMEAQKRAYKNGYSPDLIPDDLSMTNAEAKDVRHDVTVDGKKLFKASIMLSYVADSKEELKQIKETLNGKFNDYSVNNTTCRSMQLLALNSALPVGVKHIELDATLTSASCCAFNPFSIRELISKNGVFYGINEVSKNMIMYSRKTSDLANGLILGRAGSGKSFITKGEITQIALNSDDDIVILDPENEYGVLAKEFGGIVLDVHPQATLFINPCDMDMEWNEKSISPLTEKCDFMVGLVEAIMGNGRECNAYQVNAIHKATEMMYADYIAEMERRHNEGDNASIDYELCPTLKDFFKCLSSLRDGEGMQIAQQIEPYCMGRYDYFAHKTSKEVYENRNRIVVYNLCDMPSKMMEVAMKVCLSSLWNKVAENREKILLAQKEGRKYDKAIWIYLDEFHLFFKTQASASSIMSYYKRVRKYNGIMTGITQDIEDLISNREGTAMFNNSGFFIVMSQSPIGREQWQKLLNCSDSMIDYLNGRGVGVGLIYDNTTLIPFNYRIPNDTKLYKLMSTKPSEVAQ